MNEQDFWKRVNDCRKRSREKYRFYLGNYDFNDFGKGKIAKHLPKSTVGWGSRAIEMRANKTTFDCFENDNLHFTDIAKRYGLYDALDKVKEDVLVAGCGFLALVGDKILPFSAEEATGLYDWRTLNLRSGVAIFNGERKDPLSETAIPQEYVIFEPNRTIIRRAGGVSEEVIPNNIGRPLISVLTYRSSTKRPFGKSVLSQAARSAIVDASRTNRQAMVSAYYYNNKIDVLLGVDNETDVDSVEGQTGDTLTVSPNANGEIPKIGEFSQHAMAPFTDTIMIAARNFCTATKLTLANLGISSDAPQSPEALEIVSDDLRDDIAQWHIELGREIKHFCMTIYMKEHDIQKIDDNLRTLYDNELPVFKPTYRADIGKVGDGLFKIAEKAPGALFARSLWRNLGMTSEEIDRAIASIQDVEDLAL